MMMMMGVTSGSTNMTIQKSREGTSPHSLTDPAYSFAAIIPSRPPGQRTSASPCKRIYERSLCTNYYTPAGWGLPEQQPCNT